MTRMAVDTTLQATVRRELDVLLTRIRAGGSTGADDLQALLDKEAAREKTANQEIGDPRLEIMGHLHWALAHEGRHEESIAVCERFLALAPGSVEMRWRIADRLVNLGRLDDALAAYRAVAADHPDSPDAKMGIRYVLHLQRQAARPQSAAPYVPHVPPLSDRQRDNRAANEREFERGRIRPATLPHRLYLESTTKCNFYCQTCSKGYDAYYAEDLRPAIMERVRAELMPGNTRISITGFGEPTLAADFDSILALALENGSVTHFVTNASLLNFERLERLTRCPVNIVLSIDGATKETFEGVRAGSNFDLFLDKLAMIKKLRDIHLSHVFSVFSFNFVALRRNIAELADVVRLAHRFDISHVTVTDYAFNDTEFDEQSLRYDAARANACLDDAARVAAELGVKLDLPPRYEPAAKHVPSRRGLLEKLRGAGGLLPARGRFPQRCSSPWTEPYIQTDGTVVPCCTSRQFLGSIKGRSFSAVWNGWRYRLLRLRIHSPLPPLQCRRCYLPWGINGGNAGNVMAREGLLVKAWYWMEWRMFHAKELIVRRARAMKGERAPAPNYHRGKPMSAAAKSAPAEKH